ncbi:MAG: HAD family hydrolase, partial [Lentisphaeria bacterium]|nr:HAD family hydrolase [Lentisphaeria bacterium]
MKRYFIGIDSDGTAFDSMTIKHRKAFIPAMIRVWKLEEYSEKVSEICEYINLYSPTRGIDRFSGLKVTFDSFKAAGIPVPDYSGIDGFLKDAGKLSNATLTEYLKTHEDAFLKDVLVWSAEADAVFQKEVETLMPFPMVKKCLEKACPHADIAVISSASMQSLESDWKKDGLLDCVSKVYGQEFGNKKAQLKAATDGKYENICKLMLGDAKGDLEAAQSAGAWFYPMIPGREDESWQLFYDRYLDIYLDGKFDQLIQNELLEKF